MNKIAEIKTMPLNSKKQANNMKHNKTIHEIIRESTDYAIKHSYKTTQKQKLEILHNFLKEIPEEEITNTLSLSKHLYTNYHKNLNGTKYMKKLSTHLIKTWINKYHALLDKQGYIKHSKQHGGTKYKRS